MIKLEQKDMKKISDLNDFENEFAIVTKDIGNYLSIDGIGQIRYNNELWQAKSIDDKKISKGTKVKIVSKENMIMNVKAEN